MYNEYDIQQILIIHLYLTPLLNDLANRRGLKSIPYTVISVFGNCKHSLQLQAKANDLSYDFNFCYCEELLFNRTIAVRYILLNAAQCFASQ